MTFKKIYIFSFCWFFLIDLISVSGQSVTIDLADEYQEIRGFGGMSHTGWISDLNEPVRATAFGNKPGNLGLSILRIHIDPDTNRFKDQVTTSKFASEQGALVFASPWDPPAYMIDTLIGLKKLDTEMYDEYVGHLNRFNTFMNNNGVPLYAISIQNEPDYGDWTRWTFEEIVTFLKEKGQNINFRVIAPESFQFRRTFTDPILLDSAANANVDIIGGHIYGGGLFDYPLAREKGKEVWMTEHYTTSDRSANLWPDALGVGKEINDCMNANFNAYVWWYIRRFYGLITDDGLISKRGYVLSHFSKFIRPGAVRVGGIVTSVANVEASAYKTDTSLVIIVVNRNSTEVNLSFTIQNGIVDTLTKFTTSATKNVINDGGVSISGGIFNSSIEANSITTFTSDTEVAGRFGNIAPIADAGSDIAIKDTNGNGTETLLLNGSNSNDFDGTISNFNWSVDGIQTSIDTIFEYTASIGDHLIVLSVTDNDGAIDSDTISLTVTSTKSTEIWLDTECGQVGSTWVVSSDANASNGKFVMSPAGIESVQTASTDTSDLIIYSFNVPETGNYKVWGRVITPNANDDSFWIRMDEDTTWALWNSIPAGNTWHWDDVHDQSNGSLAMVYNLDPGFHSLSICFREDGARLDKILLTNTGSVPSDMGSIDNTCPEDSLPVSLNISLNENQLLLIFPNPTHSEIHVESYISFQSLIIYNLEGREVISESYNTPQNNTYLPLNLDPGIYLLQIRNIQTIKTMKLVVH